MRICGCVACSIRQFGNTTFPILFVALEHKMNKEGKFRRKKNVYPLEAWVHEVRHCTTSQVMGSVPYGVIGIVH
jgi:hypothetical protein